MEQLVVLLTQSVLINQRCPGPKSGSGSDLTRLQKNNFTEIKMYALGPQKLYPRVKPVEPLE